MISRFRGIRQVLWITLALNILSTGIKAGIGLWTGSLSLIAAGLDAFFDASSNVVGLVGIQVAARPPDPEHPYGHHKSETLAAMAIAGLLFVTVAGLVQQAVGRLLSGSAPEVSALSFAAVAAGLGIEAFTSSYERRRGRELSSDFLLADARHSRAHVYISLGVMAGLAMVWLGFPAVDPLLALVIAGVIAKIGWDILRSTSDTLLDRAAANPDEVRGLAQSVAGVESVDRVRSRGPGGSVLVDLHIHVDPDTPVDRAHEIADRVEALLMARMAGVRDV
ncbi:MAG: cation diffusion facilitator family transporter, partial [Anaerolineae bacterium]